MALVDQYGRPLKGRRLPRGIDLFFQLPQVEALSLWDVRAAKEAATAHENGLFDVSARMYYAMLTDPRIADGLDKRNLALRNMDYDIVPGDGRSARTVCNKFRRAFGMTDEGATGI